MGINSKEQMTNIPRKADQEMTSILISIPKDWVQQIDVIADFYCKSRMTFIRDFINEGIKRTTDKYQSAHQELEAMNKIFEEMSQKTAKMQADRESRKSGW